MNWTSWNTYNRGTNLFSSLQFLFVATCADWGLCIVGSCNLILYIGYILYIVKSLCDINGYVFTIERGRRTGHRRVPRAIGRHDSDVPWFSVVPHRRMRPCRARRFPSEHVCSSRVSASVRIFRSAPIGRISLVSNVHNVKLCFRFFGHSFSPSANLTALVGTRSREKFIGVPSRNGARRFALLRFPATRGNVQGQPRGVRVPRDLVTGSRAIAERITARVAYRTHLARARKRSREEHGKSPPTPTPHAPRSSPPGRRHARGPRLRSHARL